MLKADHMKRLVESYDNDRYSVLEFRDEGLSHYTVKDNNNIGKAEEEKSFSTIQDCRNYLSAVKKVKMNGLKKIDLVIPDIETIKKPLKDNKKADLKTIDGLLEEIEGSLNSFKEGRIMTADMEMRLNVYQQVVAVHALKFSQEKLKYDVARSEDRVKHLLGGNGGSSRLT